MARGKFDGVPTDELFDAAAFQDDKPHKQESIRSVAQGKCPNCTAKKTGVVRQGPHLVWRRHQYTTWSGAHIDCPSSGVALCVCPERKPLDRTNPIHCVH
jgi:hypothetical protein